MRCDDCDSDHSAEEGVTLTVEDGAEKSVCPDCAPADTLFLVVDRSTQTGDDWFENWGEIVAGVPVVRETCVTRWDTVPSCEGCNTQTVENYRLTCDSAGIPVCRSCLEDYEWLVDVVETRDELAAVDVQQTA